MEPVSVQILDPEVMSKVDLLCLHHDQNRQNFTPLHDCTCAKVQMPVAPERQAPVENLDSFSDAGCSLIGSRLICQSSGHVPTAINPLAVQLQPQM